MEDGGGGEHGGGESRRNDDVVVHGWLISRDEEGVRLAEVDVERRIGVLEGVRSFHLHQQQCMPLNPYVQ